MRWTGLLSLAIVAALGGPAYAQSRSYAEAPILAEKVRAGLLPPVGQRLPETPLTVAPHERIGVYGGVWRVGLLGSWDGPGLLRMVGYDGMMSWLPDWSEAAPNIASRVEVNADATEYVFHLRKGMKWSDGEPFTAEDFAFGLLEYTFNKDVNPILPNWPQSPDLVPDARVIDAQTVKIRFKQPIGLLLDYLATAEGQEIGLYQKKYCSRFLPRYNPAAAREAAAEGFASWEEQASAKCGRRRRALRWRYPDRPTLNAWMVESPYTEDAAEVTLVRNPYYWKVDTDGNQLPYLDRVVATVAATPEKLALLAMKGELDMQDRHINAPQNRKILERASRRGDFRFYEVQSSMSNTTVISFNSNHPDPRLRQIFEAKSFRIGVSHAINRTAIISIVYQNRTTPAQVGPTASSPLHDPVLSSQYLEHDLDKARAAFAATPGLRVRPDGRIAFRDDSPVSFTIDLVGGVVPEWEHVLDMIRADLARLGVELRINKLDRKAFVDRYESNAFDAQVWTGDGGADPMLDPRWYFPADVDSRWAPLWALWHMNPEDPRAEVPPPRVKEQMELYRTLMRTPRADDRLALMRRILDITRDEFPVIGVALPEIGYGVVRNDFHNVPDRTPFAWTYPNPGPTRPEQYFSTRGGN